jgi:hypothetical protein
MLKDLLTEAQDLIYKKYYKNDTTFGVNTITPELCISYKDNYFTVNVILLFRYGSDDDIDEFHEYYENGGGQTLEEALIDLIKQFRVDVIKEIIN